MKHIAYVQRLSGRVTPVGPGLVDVELVGCGGTPLGSRARLVSQLAFADERTFREQGMIEFENADRLCISTLGAGILTPAPGGGLRHGTAVLECEGVGRLEAVRGRITSNFVVSDDGDVTDEQVVLVFIDREE